MPTATAVDQEKTGLGNYFIANYPPFSYWKPLHLPEAHAALNAAPVPGTPLGLYLHIPFCRKRCKFCYFRVYTDKNAKDIEVYLDALLKEVSLLARKPVVGESNLPGFWQFNGCNGRGFNAGPILAELCAKLMVTGARDSLLEGFEPGRFDAAPNAKVTIGDYYAGYTKARAA